MTDCGPSAECCCTSPEVVGGTYHRTYANAGAGPSAEADPATVSGFRLDKYLVTVGRFRPFVAAWKNGAGYLPTAGSGKHTHLNGGQGLANCAASGTFEQGWDATDWNTQVAPTNANLACYPPNGTWGTWTDSPGTQENLPIDCVNWWESYAFCIWDGGFLPSEAEWVWAAAGGSQQREYPWGSTDPGSSNQYAIYACDYPIGTATCSDAGAANIAPVGHASSGAGLWGQLDLVGELFEWNVDGYATYVSPCVDCAYLPSPPASYRVFHGGDFCPLDGTLLPPSRNAYTPPPRAFNGGFRCARTP